ncbi:MAG: NAD(P)/FAD-dependent oxidoreductase, partial [Butyricicoccaceae bacterium]
IGMGPAGLFAAYMLAKNGYRPLVFERGQCIPERDRTIAAFHAGAPLRTESNIQFGEGGAGAYSDGKLTTRVNDPKAELVIQTFLRHGAPEEIGRAAKPHIGTDVLKQVVVSMREEIIRLGGEVHFEQALTGICAKDGRLTAVRVGEQTIPCEQLILAIGHSARDTFEALYRQGVPFEPKPFSVGARIEHPQELIDRGLYGALAGHPALPPASYNLSWREGGRGCYSFCMCPGGQVVAAQSEQHSIVTNGMSYHARDGRNANSAVVVSVSPEDFPSRDALAGIAFQRKIERAAYRMSGSYRAPCQRVGDFLEGRPTRRAGSVQPTYPLGVEYGDISGCLPLFVTEMMRGGLRRFGKKLRGFDLADALLTAPETRTSSPVRIPRTEERYSTKMTGLIPCGEGAGYAGGIMSAAVDGIACAAAVMQRYRPFD